MVCTCGVYLRSDINSIPLWMLAGMDGLKKKKIWKEWRALRGRSFEGLSFLHNILLI